MCHLFKKYDFKVQVNGTTIFFYTLQKRSFPGEALHASENLRETIRYRLAV